MKQKGFAPIIILVLIALAVAGYFGYKNYWPNPKTSEETPLISMPTPVATADPTANWKTYKNTNPPYTLQYPNQWIFDESAHGECVGPTFFTSSTKKSWLTICRVDNPDGLTGSEKMWRDSNGYTNITSTKINGLNAITSEIQQFESQYEFNVEFEATSKTDLLWFHLTTEVSGKENNKKLFDQILSTFKFTK